MMKKRVLKKLKSRGGETLAEVLIALLIAALALTMLAGLISASGKLILKSVNQMGVYLNAENGLVQHQTVSADSYDKGKVSTASGTVTLTITMIDMDDGGAGTGVSWAWPLSDAEEDADGTGVTVYESNVLGKKPVISYKVN